MSDDAPGIGGNNNRRSGSEPALPFKTLKFPLKSRWSEWVLTPNDIESTPEWVQGHRYVAGFSRTEHRSYISVIDASVHLLVGYHILAQGLSGQIERVEEIARQWGDAFVIVDAGNGGEHLAEAIRLRGVSAMADRPNSEQVYNDFHHLLAALQDGRLVVYPDHLLFAAFRSVDFVMNYSTGGFRVVGLTPDEGSLLFSVALAWRAAMIGRYRFGAMA